MLIDKDGIRVFNEYDLGVTLKNQLSKIKKEIDFDIESNPPENQEEYVAQKTDKFRIKPLEFNKDGIEVTVSKQNIPAEYFPSSGFFVDPGERYEKEILTFYLPFDGDQSLLRCVPSTRILRTEEVQIKNKQIIFDIINFYNKSEIVKKEMEEIVKFLEDQATYVNKEVNQYNENLSKVIISAIEQTTGKISGRLKFIEELGVPLKTEIDKKEIDKNTQQISSRVTDTTKQEFDVFISYASEDKDFVEKLAKQIEIAGFKVWYDSFQIGWGQDLRPAIDNGLKNSRYGIVILSKSFLKKKKWTEYELNGLFSREERSKQVILPIWHNIDRKDLEKYSPTFADRVALKSDSIENIIKELRDKLK